MSRLHVREAVAADLPAIVALLADDVLGAQREDTSLPVAAGYLEAFAAIAAAPGQTLWAAELDGRVVGTLQLALLHSIQRKGSRHGLVEVVRIASHLRGQGLGKEMIRWAIEQCRAQGCASVQLTSDNSRLDAHRFYEQLGFKATHAGYKLVL